jgi:predicted nucleic acid-binding Zn ribbon protein
LTNWKPLDEDQSPRPVRASLDALARRLGAPGAVALEALFDGWPDVVGEGVAAHTRPRSLRNGTLSVAVDSPAWATELRSLTAGILARCDEVAGPGVVTAIDVRVGL